MANKVIPGIAVTNVRITREHVPTNVFGSSYNRDNYIHLKDMHNGKEIGHNAALDKVLFRIRNPSTFPSEGSSTRLLSHVLRCKLWQYEDRHGATIRGF